MLFIFPLHLSRTYYLPTKWAAGPSWLVSSNRRNAAPVSQRSRVQIMNKPDFCFPSFLFAIMTGIRGAVLNCDDLLHMLLDRFVYLCGKSYGTNDIPRPKWIQEITEEFGKCAGRKVNKRLCNNRRTRGRFEVMGARKNGTRNGDTLKCTVPSCACRVFSHFVTTAMLVSQNTEKAMLMS